MLTTFKLKFRKEKLIMAALAMLPDRFKVKRQMNAFSLAYAI